MLYYLVQALISLVIPKTMMVIIDAIMTIDNTVTVSIPETLSDDEEEESDSMSLIKSIVPICALISIIQTYEVIKTKNRNKI